ncbi:MFS transporter [Sphingomonas sp. KRR8]|uniref:MFS transporter n=1 Tax=Sphingomonas sp. KRR8 TaxID=2942996 RepID=UPI00201FE103|nr:MFS transporter [Sphingomonas sp. KRR8]URD62389.1 MFS transporter [Sphingomonas sp. KRR8]URD62391.1 MFS transporter [Sphingomonas sp. KRR8]
MTGMTEKPRLNWAGLWNLSFGFFGIQIGFALQNANMSRVFQSLGAKVEELPALWVAAPLTGLLVQPIIGFLSDRTWLGRFGRRRPYFVGGALLAALSLVLMPFSHILLMAGLLLWTLDASLNISMEPFRAFVGDVLRKDQHTAGYAVQTAFIGAGAVAGSIFPYLLEHLGVANEAPGGGVPPTVQWSFWTGGAALLVAVIWTVLSTREYSPDELREFGEPVGHEGGEDTVRLLASRSFGWCLGWIAAGAVVIFGTREFALQKEVYLLGALLAGYGMLSALAIGLVRQGRSAGMLASIVGDFSGMPPVMKKLALVQFFTWSALFIMWTFTTPVVAQYFFDTTDSNSKAFQDAGNWVGVLSAVYNGIAAVAALTLLPFLSRKIGKVRTHVFGLLCGAAGFASLFILRTPNQLIFAQIGIGIAWASLLAMPYAILASSLPQRKLGIYMGLFNVFVVVPQLLVATVMGSIMKAFFPGQPIWTMAFAAGTLVLAALATLRVRENAPAV